MCPLLSLNPAQTLGYSCRRQIFLQSTHNAILDVTDVKLEQDAFGVIT